jgi:hypothetical protein
VEEKRHYSNTTATFCQVQRHLAAMILLDFKSFDSIFRPFRAQKYFFFN